MKGLNRSHFRRSDKSQRQKCPLSRNRCWARCKFTALPSVVRHLCQPTGSCSTNVDPFPPQCLCHSATGASVSQVILTQRPLRAAVSRLKD